MKKGMNMKYDICMIDHLKYDYDRVVSMTHQMFCPSEMKYMLPHTGYERLHHLLLLFWT